MQFAVWKFKGKQAACKTYFVKDSFEGGTLEIGVDAGVQRVGDQVACKHSAVFANAYAGGVVHEGRVRNNSASGAGGNLRAGFVI